MLQVILPESIDIVLSQLGANSRNEKYRDDPVLWAKEVLGVTLWGKQKEICEAVIDHRRVACRAANGVGKSKTCGVLAAWWIATQYARDPQETVVVITAPSFSQIQNNMFHELRLAMAQSQSTTYEGGKPKNELYAPLPGKINASGNSAVWKTTNGDELAIGRKPAEQDIITTFQGIHRKNVLFIIDEAGGMPSDMFEAAERMTTNKNARILAVGNPDRRGSEFFKLFKEDSIWHKMKISAYDTPPFTGEPCPEELLEFMPDKENVAMRLKKYGGPDDPRAKISIFGEFPDSDETVFFTETAMDKADDKIIDPNMEDDKILGVDLSMFGSDESVVYFNQSNRIRKVDSWGQLGTQAAVDRLHDLAVALDVDYVNIDSGGIGAPIISQLKTSYPESERKYRIVEMNSSAAPPDRRRWVNAKAWWYDRLREDMVMGYLDLDLPRDSKLRSQMTDINSEFAEGTRAGAIKMESKKDMKKRVGYSPDEVDAVVYAHMHPHEVVQVDNTPTKTQVFESPSELLDEVPAYLQMIESVFYV